MFRLLEKIIDPTRARVATQPPAGLLRFYWHFVRQAKGLFVALFAAGLCVALLDASVPWFIGRLVRLITTARGPEVLAAHAGLLGAMAVVLLVGRPLAIGCQSLISNTGIVAGMTNLVRWQSHLHVVRQSWPFFQNDFAGRIAARVMETGPAVRQSAVAGVTAVWGILVYGASALALLGTVHPLLMLPVLFWFAAYGVMLRVFVPRVRERSKRNSEARSLIVGRIVDSYTNIVTLKLFARLQPRGRLCARGDRRPHARPSATSCGIMSAVHRSRCRALNALMLASQTDAGDRRSGSRGTHRRRHGGDGDPAHLANRLGGGLGRGAGDRHLRARRHDPGGHVDHRPADRAGRPARRHGRSRCPAATILLRARSHSATAAAIPPPARPRRCVIRPGEKIGLVGRSGAGKTTLVNLLLRFHDLDAGRILVDGQDIADVTQESLRGAISVVTQDTSLLHRSIGENIAYGRPDAGSGRDRGGRPAGACPRLHRRPGPTGRGAPAMRRRWANAA